MAVGTGTALALGAGANILGGVLGAEEGRKGRAAQKDAMNQALAQFAGIEVPELQAFSPEELKYLGDFDPRLEQALTLQDTAMEQVAADPRLQAQQMAALESIAGMTGQEMTPAEQAALMQIRRGAAAEAQAKQGQILQNMQARGLGGSGAELIAKLKAAQSGADRQGAMGLDVAKQAQQRALQAMSQQGQLAGNIHAQDVGEQERLAAARDVVNKFNLTNQQAVGQRNVAAQNQAGLRNLQTQQDLANRNVAQRNLAQQHNIGRDEREFQMQRQLAANRAGIQADMGNQAAQAGANMASGIAQIGAGLGQGLGAYAGYSHQNDMLKKLGKQDV